MASDVFVTVVVFHFVDEFLDVLLLGAGADQQYVVGVDHDVLLQPADDGYLVLGQRDDRRARVAEVAPLLGGGVGIAVLARVLVERAPRPHVAPAELAAADIDVAGLLQNAVVDRDGAALREDHLHDVLLGVGAQGAHQAAEEGVVLGQVLLEGLDDASDLPDEDARIPEEFARPEKRLRQFEVGFLGEALHLADRLRVRHLDVAVACVGPRGFDAHGHQRIVVRGEPEALLHDGAEVFFVEDQMVRRGDDHLGPGVLLQQRVGRIGDAGRRVAAHGFAEHLLLVEFGQVFQHQLLVFAVGHDQEVLRRDHRREAFVGVADEGLARSQDVEELLGHRLAALGPEARADAAGHDDAISVVDHLFSVYIDRCLFGCSFVQGFRLSRSSCKFGALPRPGQTSFAAGASDPFPLRAAVRQHLRLSGCRSGPSLRPGTQLPEVSRAALRHKPDVRSH